MTENELRNSVVGIARSYLGTAERSAKHKEILNIYNGYKDSLRRNYVVKETDSWCMTFVSACFIAVGLADLIVTECGCGEAISRNSTYKKNWVENDAYVPKPGDIIMYDWQDSGKGDNTEWPDHTGIVEECDGKNITVIEGNKSDAVGKRTLSVNGRYIRGYIVPDFASKASAAEVDGVEMLSVTEKLWLRKAPVDGTGIVTMPAGSRVKALSKPWVKVQYEKDGKTYTGWASVKYLQ